MEDTLVWLNWSVRDGIAEGVKCLTPDPWIVGSSPVLGKILHCLFPGSLKSPLWWKRRRALRHHHHHWTDLLFDLCGIHCWLPLLPVCDGLYVLGVDASVSVVFVNQGSVCDHDMNKSKRCTFNFIVVVMREAWTKVDTCKKSFAPFVCCWNASDRYVVLVKSIWVRMISFQFFFANWQGPFIVHLQFWYALGWPNLCFTYTAVIQSEWTWHCYGLPDRRKSNLNSVICLSISCTSTAYALFSCICKVCKLGSL